MPSVSQEVTVDAKGHLLGRLAATVAKQLLEGVKVTVVRCEEMDQAGKLFRNHLKYLAFLRKKSNSNPRVHSHIHYRAPSMLFRRVVRGMLPHKTPRGTAALKRLTVMEGVPGKYNMTKRMVCPAALTHIHIAKDMPVTRLGDLSGKVGWKSDSVVKKLEQRRKEKSHERYEKRRAAAKELQAKREAAIQAASPEIRAALALVHA